MTHPIIEKMADSFLKWDLPFNFRSDECVTKIYYEFPRSGTNIMDRSMAINMLEHIIKDLGITLSITPDPVTTTLEKTGIKTTPVCGSYKEFHDDYLNRMRGISITSEGGPWYNPPMSYGVTPNMSHIEYFLKKEGKELERITPEVATYTRDIFPPAKDPEVVEVLKKAAEIACELDIENTEAIRDAHLSIFDYLAFGERIIITKNSEHRKLTKTILEVGYDRGEIIKYNVDGTEYYQVYGVEARQRANRILNIVMDIKEQRRKKLDTRIPDVAVETFLEWDKDWNNDKVDIRDVFEGLADSKLRDTTTVAGYCISLDNTDAKWHVIEKPEKLLKLISCIREVTIHGGENYRRYITKITSPNEILDAIYAAKYHYDEDKSETEEFVKGSCNKLIEEIATKYFELVKTVYHLNTRDYYVEKFKIFINSFLSNKPTKGEYGKVSREEVELLIRLLNIGVDNKQVNIICIKDVINYTLVGNGFSARIKNLHNMVDSLASSMQTESEEKKEIDPKLKNVNIKYAAKKYLEWDKGIDISLEEMCKILKTATTLGVKIDIDDAIIIKDKKSKEDSIETGDCSKLLQLLNHLNASIISRVVEGRQIVEVTYLLNSGMVEVIKALKNKELSLDTTDYKKATFRTVNL